MKAYQIGAQTGLGSLTRADVPDPIAGPSEVVLRVNAVCLNHRDLLILNGTYGPRKPEDRIPVSDGVGDVMSIGGGVTGVSIGDRVVAPHFARWIDGAFSQSVFATDLGVTCNGWLAERIVVPAAALVKVPDALSDEQVAALPAAGITAWNALIEVGKVKTGDVVLALGTGGVSIFALQIAKLKGARVAITSSSDEKLALARQLGAEFTINYRTTPDWPTALMAATGGAGADIIIETGGQSTLDQSLAAAAVGGRIVLIGALAGVPGRGLANFQAIIGKNLALKGITSGSRAMLAALIGAVEMGGIKPVIDKVFAFDDAAAAYAYLNSGAHLGKVMIKVR